ncbi:MAG: mandelate racemase/muconate lactonizing enzyme family protein [Verrucomicrobia bacterium]|nr:mandelate racemase/muconate lactonizing enzyme family protein [Verrucomicrobiota bacterium]MBI3868067.1 mandelate racemase/muconate lactonizing enzyme family protein [Verrucomicrobiota bacterium]
MSTSQATDIRVREAELYYLPIQNRVPLKFGPEIVTSVTCARARVVVESGAGMAVGWGETPLSAQWVWPGDVPYAERHEALKAFTETLGDAWTRVEEQGHAFDLGHRFIEDILPGLLNAFNGERRAGREPMPHLAALVCASVFDQALHDAYGNAVGRPVYETYRPPFLQRDLSHFLTPAAESAVSFRGLYPRDFLLPAPRLRLPAWHLVGGVDALETQDLTGSEPRDEHPLLLADWIRRDGLRCLKVKLRGNDAAWDFDRFVRVGQIAVGLGVDWLSADFNCTVREPAYVNEILDRLRTDHPRLYGMLLYVEQPFPYDLEKERIDTHSIASRKPLFLDESAHDWRVIRRGRELGWNGVALKTCKTQTGALLSGSWAKAHGMSLMVQDLTNPMLAQIPHVLLAAHMGTLMGVETNSSQYYPAASAAEEAIHPGLYRRREGRVDASTLRGPGFGARVAEIARALPPPRRWASRLP